jgi:hypothetical protein
MHLDATDDGAVWMLNLMKYKEVADYGEAGGPTVSGKEADDLYAPTEVLNDLGAPVALFGDVIEQHNEGVAWDRIGIVRYPSRASFFAMQNREDFQKQYVHKQAGMEATIVMGCLPHAAGDPSTSASGPLVMRVRRLSEGDVVDEDPAGVVPVAHFVVDGVIIGDGRTWTDVRFDRLDGISASDLAGSKGVDDEVVVVIDPEIDWLIPSLADSFNS